MPQGIIARSLHLALAPEGIYVAHVAIDTFLRKGAGERKGH